MSKSTMYLYDIDPNELIPMNYLDAIQYKLRSAKQLIADLHELGYLDRDEERVSAVYKAINHNQMLLDELKC